MHHVEIIQEGWIDLISPGPGPKYSTKSGSWEIRLLGSVGAKFRHTTQDQKISKNLFIAQLKSPFPDPSCHRS